MSSDRASTTRDWRHQLPAAVRPYVEAAPTAAFFLGISSGFGFAMIAATLTTRLAQHGITKSAVTAFALTFLAFNFKWIWAPLVDTVRIPVLGRFGPRRSWLWFVGLLVMAAVMFLGSLDPTTALPMVAVAAILVGIATVVGYSFQTVPDWGRGDVLHNPELAAIVDTRTNEPQRVVFVGSPPFGHMTHSFPANARFASMFAYSSNELVLDADLESETFPKLAAELIALGWNEPAHHEALREMMRGFTAMLSEAVHAALDDYALDDVDVEAVATLIRTFQVGMIAERLAGIDQGHAVLRDAIDAWLESLPRRSR